MGNFCSSKHNSHSGHSHLTSSSSFSSLSHSLSFSTHPTYSPTQPTTPIVIPSLFDLCLEQLCLSLIDQTSLDNMTKRQKSKDEMTALDYFLYSQLHSHQQQIRRKQLLHDSSPLIYSNRKGKNRRSIGSPPSDYYRTRSLSLSSKESPELTPQPSPFSPSSSTASTTTVSPLFASHSASPFSLSIHPMLSPIHPPLHPRTLSLAHSPSLSALPSARLPPSIPLPPYSYSAATTPPRVTNKRETILTHMQQRFPFSLPASPLVLPTRSYEESDLPSPTPAQAPRRNSWYAGSPPNATISFMSLPPSLHHPLASRLLRLPDSVIQLIFTRLIQHQLLTLSTLQLFRHAQLTKIGLGRYEGVTDEWMDVLLTAAREYGEKNEDSTQKEEVEEEEGEEEEEEEEQKGKENQVKEPHPPASAPMPIFHLNKKSTGPQSFNTVSPISIDTSEDARISTSASPPSLNLSPMLKSVPFPLQTTLASRPPSLTYLDLSKCDAVSNTSLLPLQYTSLLNYLSLDGCTQISDELLTLILPNKPHLTYLNLCHCRSVTNVTLPFLPMHLRTLYLDSTGVTDIGLRNLSLPHLHTFSVGWNGNRVTSEGLSWLSTCFHLRTLILCYTSVTDASVYKSLKRLKILNIAGTKMVDSASSNSNGKRPQLLLDQLLLPRAKIKDIPVLLLWSGLKVLDVSFTSISPPKMIAMLNQLIRNTVQSPSKAEKDSVCIVNGIDDDSDAEEEEHDGVRSINPNRSSFRKVSVDSSPTLLPLSALTLTPQSQPLPPTQTPANLPPPLSLASQPIPQLKVLRMESCGVDNSVLALLPSFPLLVELNVSDTEVTGEGLTHLASLPQLTALNLSGCKLHNPSLSALSTLTQLRDLRMDCPTVTDAGLLHLAGLINLEHLDLFETHITDAGIVHLSTLTSLRSLECCCGKLTNTAMATLSNLASLTSLNLSQNSGITDSGMSGLVKLNHLVHINLSGTSVTHKGLNFLSSLPSVRSVSLFGCKVKCLSSKIKELPPGVQLGVDEGIVAVEP